MELLELLPHLKDHPIIANLILLVFTIRFCCGVVTSVFANIAKLCRKVDARWAIVVGKISYSLACFFNIFADRASRRLNDTRYRKRND